MIDQPTFRRYVREAYARLDDRPFLMGHPIAAALASGSAGASSDVIRQTLLTAIGRVRPPDGTPPSSTNWRRWRALHLRYVEGEPPARVARLLMVSERQARRDHRLGVDAVAGLLWSSYCRKIEASRRGRHDDLGESPAGRKVLGDVAVAYLDAELARVMTAQTGELTGLVEGLENALVTVQNLAEARGVRFAVTLPATSPVVEVNPAVLRQILLCILTAILARSAVGDISIAVMNSELCVQLRLQCIVSSAPESISIAAVQSPHDVEDLFRAAEHLTCAQGGRLDVAFGPDRLLRADIQLPSVRRATVLVVDDNPDLGELFRRYLTGLAYRVVQARTPPTALDLARELQPDVVILDVMMPSQDGWQILSALRGSSRLRTVPVIVCSILPEKALALSLGVSAFLAKPVTQQSLRLALEACLGGHLAAAHPDFPASNA